MVRTRLHTIGFDASGTVRGRIECQDFAQDDVLFAFARDDWHLRREDCCCRFPRAGTPTSKLRRCRRRTDDNAACGSRSRQSRTARSDSCRLRRRRSPAIHPRKGAPRHHDHEQPQCRSRESLELTGHRLRSPGIPPSAGQKKRPAASSARRIQSSTPRWRSCLYRRASRQAIRRSGGR